MAKHVDEAERLRITRQLVDGVGICKVARIEHRSSRTVWRIAQNLIALGVLTRRPRSDNRQR